MLNKLSMVSVGKEEGGKAGSRSYPVIKGELSLRKKVSPVILGVGVKGAQVRLDFLI